MAILKDNGGTILGAIGPAKAVEGSNIHKEVANALRNLPPLMPSFPPPAELYSSGTEPLRSNSPGAQFDPDPTASYSILEIENGLLVEERVGFGNRRNLYYVEDLAAAGAMITALAVKRKLVQEEP